MAEPNDGIQAEGSADSGAGAVGIDDVIQRANAFLSDEKIRGIRGDMFSMQKRHKRNRILGKIVTYLGIGAAIFATGVLTKDYVVSAYENARESIVSTAGSVKDTVVSTANSLYESGNDVGYDITHTDPEEMGEKYMAKIDEYSETPNTLDEYQSSLLNVADKIIFSIDANKSGGQKGLEQVTWSAFNRMSKEKKKEFVGEASKRVAEGTAEQPASTSYAQPK
ncbi:hypothetical protein HY636_03910 [Candidatus Woesearchaeota archaeon]|nr:hypothetical protein [Candidatus Woesearchaeota archaeon]